MLSVWDDFETWGLKKTRDESRYGINGQANCRIVVGKERWCEKR